jgi:hypothetical protein
MSCVVVVVAVGVGDSAEVLAFEPVAVAFELMTSARWRRRSIMAAATVSSPKISP